MTEEDEARWLREYQELKKRRNMQHLESERRRREEGVKPMKRSKEETSALGADVWREMNKRRWGKPTVVKPLKPVKIEVQNEPESTDQTWILLGQVEDSRRQE